MAGLLNRGIDVLAAVNSRVMPFLVRVASILIWSMTAVVVVGVFFRYVLNNSLPWAEEFAILSAIWVAFLVAPHAYRTGGHVAIELIISALPNAVTRGFRIILNLLVLWILYRFFFEALTFVERGNFQRANTIPVQTSWFRSIVPLSLAMMTLVGVELILRDLFGLITGSRDRDLPHLQPVEPE
ncbi:MAG: TRAP transporter small permease [Pseudomonadota bacterium]